MGDDYKRKLFFKGENVMAAATQKTKWRRLVKKQLVASSLPTENEMSYRQYVNVIYRVANYNSLGDDLYKIERKKLIACLHKYMDKKSVLPWEQDLTFYTSALLMDATEEKLTPAFQGASLFCGECYLPVKINQNGSRYVCAHCNAQVKAGPNRFPLGIPVLQEMRHERNRLHLRMDSIMGHHKKIASMRDKYYRELANVLDMPYELVHIGLITTQSDVVKWDLAMDFIINALSLQSRENNNVAY